jgi:hypothetical protein
LTITIPDSFNVQQHSEECQNEKWQLTSSLWLRSGVSGERSFENSSDKNAVSFWRDETTYQNKKAKLCHQKLEKKA